MFYVSKETLPLTRSTLIPLPHAFSTRRGGVSEGAFASLNFRSGAGDSDENIAENMTRLMAAFGRHRDDCAVTHQVHGANVRIVSSADRHPCGGKVPYDADGIGTVEAGLPLACFTADCVPVLLCDPVRKVIGAIHCGWRSSAADILGSALAKMQALGADPKSLLAAIGPALGPCCFETHRDVPDAVDVWLGADAEGIYREIGGGKYLVDLKEANARRLLQLGLQREQIDISPECTCCSHDSYWSHRYTKGNRGLQCAVIMLED